MSMNIADAIITASSAADTVFNFTTFNWTKKKVICLAATTLIFMGGAVALSIFGNKSKNTASDSDMDEMSNSEKSDDVVMDVDYRETNIDNHTTNTEDNQNEQPTASIE